MWITTGVIVGSGIKIFAQRTHHKKTFDSTKKTTMPARLRIGSEVSSVASRQSKLIDPPPGKKRRVRERVYGIIMRSMVGGLWEVRWATGAVESISPNNLKLEGDPSPETEAIVLRYNRRR